MMEYEKSAYSVEEVIHRLGREYGELRKQKGYTQKQVSEHSGLSIFTISTFESGASTGLTLAAYIKLLRAIECFEKVERLTNIHE